MWIFLDGNKIWSREVKVNGLGYAWFLLFFYELKLFLETFSWVIETAWVMFIYLHKMECREHFEYNQEVKIFNKIQLDMDSYDSCSSYHFLIVLDMVWLYIYKYQLHTKHHLYFWELIFTRRHFRLYHVEVKTCITVGYNIRKMIPYKWMDTDDNLYQKR